MTTDSLARISLRGWIVASVVLLVLAAVTSLGWAISKTFEPTGIQKIRALMTAISVPLVLLWFHNRQGLSARRRIVTKLIVLAIIAAFSAGIVLVVFQNLNQPAQWDFLVFWLDGKVGAQGVNFYEPANYQSVPLPFAHTDAFDAEVLKIGFRYPPLSMLLFLPLGYFDVLSAMALWYAAHGLILALSAVLLWKLFLAKDGVTGLLFAIALIAVVAGTISTFKLAQTNILALLLLLFFWRDRDRTRGGIWLILAAYVKPFLLMLLLYPVLRKNFRSVLAALATLIITSALSIGVFGNETVVAFIESNPASRMPNDVYIQVADQSLLSTILRLTENPSAAQSPLVHPVYLFLAAVLTGISCWLVFHQRDEDSEWGLALLLMLALLIYPASYYAYNVLLIVPLLLLWMSREGIPSGVWGIGALIAVVLVLIVFSGLVFVAYLLLWLAISAIAAWKALGSKRTPRDSSKYPQRANEHLQSVEPGSESIA